MAGYDPRALVSWVRRTGGVPSPNGDDPMGHLLERSGCPRWPAAPGGTSNRPTTLTMRFTGVPAASHMSMTAAWLTDNRDLDLLEYDAGCCAAPG